MTEPLQKYKTDLRRANQYYKVGRYNKASSLYEDILKTHPNHHDALDGMRRIALKQSRYSDALQYAQKYMNLSFFRTADQYANLGYILNKLRRVDEAIQAYKHAIQLRPHSASLYHKLAHVYRTNGRTHEAEHAYQEVFRRDAAYINSYYPYSNVHTFTPDDSIIQQMLSLLSDPKISSHERVKLQFAMGKAENDLGNYENAFHYYKRANDTVSKKENFDVKNHAAEVNDLILKMPTARILDFELRSKMLHTPIFIVGLSRSGKSLTEKFLSYHPDITSGGEGDEWYTAINTVLPKDDVDWIGGTLQGLTDESKNIIGEVFQERIASECINTPYVIHSMPFGYWYVSLMLEIFPNAKIIHCIRDPWDNMWSIYAKYYQSGNGYAYDWNKLIPFVDDNLNIMNHWKALYSDKIFTVQYEDLCIDYSSTIQNILTFLEVSDRYDGSRQPSSHQIGISRNYISYCMKIVQNETLMNLQNISSPLT